MSSGNEFRSVSKLYLPSEGARTLAFEWEERYRQREATLGPDHLDTLTAARTWACSIWSAATPIAR